MSIPNPLKCAAQSRRLIDERGKPPDMSAPATVGDAQSAGFTSSNPDKDTRRL